MKTAEKQISISYTLIYHIISDEVVFVPSLELKGEKGKTGLNSEVVLIATFYCISGVLKVRFLFCKVPLVHTIFLYPY